MTDQAYTNLTEGQTVYGSDSEKIGKIAVIQADHFVVEKGFFFPTDHYIPMTAVSSADDKDVYLSVTKDQALNQGWDAAPETTGDGYAAPTGGYPEGAYASGTTADMASGANEQQPFEHRTSGTGGQHIDDQDQIRIPVHEEELSATRREVDRGSVRVEKDVVAEERTIDVPVTEERVRVERHAVDRPATQADGAFVEGDIDVPVHGEEVDLQKRTRVSEEIDIDKEAVQHTERATGTVRREQVHVEDSTNQGR